MARLSDEGQGAGAIRSWLARPFPLWRGAGAEASFVLAATIVAAAFIYVTRPFGFSQIPDATARPLILQLAAACAAAALVARVAGPFLVQQLWDEGRWTVGLQILWECAEIALITCAIMLVLSAHMALPFTVSNVAAFMGVTALCALFPMAIRTFLVERWLRERNERALAQTTLGAAGNAAQALRIEGADATLSLAAGTLRYIRAEQNYVEVVWRDDALRKRLLRCTLADVERQLVGEAVVRCHRSYVVALASITKIDGNAQGYRLMLDGVADPVPVSRARAAAVLALLRPRLA